jgi:hypothetical protein
VADSDRLWRRYEGWNDTDSLKAEAERAFARGAHVNVPTLRRALCRVVADGYYGPLGDREWEEMDGARMDMRRAIAIVRAAVGASVGSAIVFHPDSEWRCDGDGCRHPDHAGEGEIEPMFHPEPIEIDADALRRWYFRELLAIYGTVFI